MLHAYLGSDHRRPSRSDEPLALDAGLIEAARELDQLDTNIAKAVAEGGGKDLEDLPEAVTLNTRRDEVLDTLCETEARTIAGVEAKAQALRTPDLIADYERHGALAVSLAEDIARLAEERASAEREPPPGTMLTVESGPGMWIAIARAIPIEGKRLFKLASGEFDAQVAALCARGVEGAALEEHRRRLRRELRLDALFELTDDASDHMAAAALSLADAADLPTVPTTSEAHLDATLLAYEPRLRALKAEMDAKLAEANRIEASLEATVSPKPQRGDPGYAAWAERWDAAKTASGYEAAYDAFEHSVEDRNDVLDEISKMPAWTLDGLCLKVRYGEGYDPIDESVVADLTAIDHQRFAGPLGSGKVDPVLAAIAASRAALAEHIAACNATDSEAPAGDARRTAARDAAHAAWLALLSTRPTTVAGVQALAGYLVDHISNGGAWDQHLDADALTLFRTIRTADLGDGLAHHPDPVFAAAAAHRSAHIDWLATLKQPDDALRNAAMDRKAAAFEALLTTRPRTEAGRLVYVTQALFEFCHAADGPPAESWVREAGRQINGGFPITEESVPRLAIEPTAAGSALDAAIEAYDSAYAHRLYSAVAGEADVVERAEQEREAFRRLLHMPLGSDAARVAYAIAVLGRAAGHHGDECLGEGRTAPLAVAYRNLAHGQFWPEDEAPLPMAAE